MSFTYPHTLNLRQKTATLEKNRKEEQRLIQELEYIETSRQRRMEKLDFDYLTYQKKLQRLKDRVSSMRSSASKYELKDDAQIGVALQGKSGQRIPNRASLHAENCVPHLDYMGSSKSELPKDEAPSKGEPRLLRRRAATFDSHSIISRDRNLSSNELQEHTYRNKSHSFTAASQNVASQQEVSANSLDDISSLEMNRKPLSMHSKGDGRKRNGTPHPKLEELFLLDQHHTKSDDRCGNLAQISPRRFTVSYQITPLAGHVSQPRKCSAPSAEETQKLCSLDTMNASQSRQQLTGENNSLSMGVDSKGSPRQRKTGIQNWILHKEEIENSEETIKEMKSLDLPVIDENAKLGRSRSNSLSPMVQRNLTKEREGIIGHPLRQQHEGLVCSIRDKNEPNEHIVSRSGFEAQANENVTLGGQRQRAKSLPSSDSSVGPNFLRGVKNREKRCFSDSSESDIVDISRLRNQRH
eukprot:Seg6892.1 transcript_id=Seg6892.1/GoldUCD/mRNA.D3Y31 product="hypothetical protein" protein_id=Seg6892.1/GoldUCD/D3Y31